MDPEELQEIGLFILLGIVWATLMRTRLGDYEEIVTLVIVGLFVVGILLVGYGMLLMRRTGRLVRREDDRRK